MQPFLLSSQQQLLGMIFSAKWIQRIASVIEVIVIRGRVLIIMFEHFRISAALFICHYLSYSLSVMMSLNQT